MYKLVAGPGDAVGVPQVVFSKLTAGRADTGRFRVALYVVQHGGAEPAQAARDLFLKESEVRRALEYWEGAGLLQKVETLPADMAAMEPRRRLCTREVASAAQGNAALGGLVAEMQRIFGGVISQADVNIFTTLHVVDGFAVDFILLAAMHCAAEKKANARYIEKLLLGWRREGITNSVLADEYLRLLAQRRTREKQVAKMLGVGEEAFTLAERKKIAQWYEEYQYGKEMIEAARTAAGEQQGNVSYLAGILKKWQAKGYKTPKDVYKSGDNRNAQARSTRQTMPENDPLQRASAWQPAGKQRGEL